MDSRNKIASLEHFVGQYLVHATFSEDTELARQGLVQKLKPFSDEPLVNKCISFLESNEWSSPEAVKAFRKWYDGLNVSSYL